MIGFLLQVFNMTVKENTQDDEWEIDLGIAG
jgi:hypothetical protein